MVRQSHPTGSGSWVLFCAPPSYKQNGGQSAHDVAPGTSLIFRAIRGPGPRAFQPPPAQRLISFEVHRQCAWACEFVRSVLLTDDARA